MAGKQTQPLPIFDADRFEFGGREIPEHVNRDPTDKDRNPALWAVGGVVRVGSEEQALLAANISGIGDEIGEDGEAIAAMLASARLGYLSRTQPDAGLFDGNEAQALIPQAKLGPLYKEGMRKAEAARAKFAGARANPQPIGQAANGGADTRIGLIPLPATA